MSSRTNNRNAALVQAAADRFAEVGFKATSIRDIARAVDMLPGSVCYHFPSWTIFCSPSTKLVVGLEAKRVESTRRSGTRCAIGTVDGYSIRSKA